METLVDFQPVSEDYCGGGVLVLDELLNHLVAVLNVVLVQLLLYLLTSFQ